MSHGYRAAQKETREKLYKEIWTEPMTTVAARYGVSSNYLAQICTRLNVPRPSRGYWVRNSRHRDHRNRGIVITETAAS